MRKSPHTQQHVFPPFLPKRWSFAETEVPAVRSPERTRDFRRCAGLVAAWVVRGSPFISEFKKLHRKTCNPGSERPI